MGEVGRGQGEDDFRAKRGIEWLGNARSGTKRCQIVANHREGVGEVGVGGRVIDSAPCRLRRQISRVRIHIYCNYPGALQGQISLQIAGIYK